MQQREQQLWFELILKLLQNTRRTTTRLNISSCFSGKTVIVIERLSLVDEMDLMSC